MCQVTTIESKEYLNIKWSNKSGKSRFYEYLFYGICTWGILSEEYKQVVENYFNEIDETFSIFGESVSKVDIIKNFLNNKQLFEYYNIGELVLTEMFIESVISDLEMGQLLALLRTLETSDVDKSIFLREIMMVLNEEFDYYISELELLEYVDDLDWLYDEVNNKMSFHNLESLYGNLDEIETEAEAEELIEAIKNHSYNEESYLKNMNDFCEEIITKIIDQIKDEFQGINQDELLEGFIVLLKKTVTIEKIFDLAYEEIIKSYEDDYDGYDEYRESQYYGSESEMDYLEILFEREPSN